MDRVKLFWAGRNTQQRIYLGVGLAITLGVAAFFGEDDGDARVQATDVGARTSRCASDHCRNWQRKRSPILSALTARPSPSRPIRSTPPGSKWRPMMSPHSGRIGFEIFDKVSWGQTEFDEKVNYQRALEGELERTIQTMSNVKSARVHLVMATDSVFMDRERGAKASVTLRLKGGTLSASRDLGNFTAGRRRGR